MKQMIYQKNRKAEILDKGVYEGIDYVILSHGTYPTAYIRIPKSHPLYDVNYSEHAFDFDVHGGITWSGSFPDKVYDAPGFWYGWDYAHLGDYMGYEEIFPPQLRTGGKKWTTEEILEDVHKAINHLRSVQ